VPNNAAYPGQPDHPGLLITRPDASAHSFARMVQEQLGDDLDSIVSPILSISPLQVTLDISRYPTLIFTSAHAVRALSTQTKRRDFTCYSVGRATLACAAAEGFDAQDGGGTANALARRIISDQPRTPCLYLRGEHIAQDLAKELCSAGIETHEAVIYRQEETALTVEAQRLLSSGRPVLLPLFSARSARLFFDRYEAAGPIDCVAMSQNVAAEVPADRVRRLRICAHPTAEAMVAEIAYLLQATNQLEGRLSPK